MLSICKEGERLDEVNDRLSLIQKPEGLTFGTDALLLAAYIRKTGGQALELGSGSGIISLLLAAREKFSHITAAEVQPDYADLTARNIVLNRLENKITALCADIRNTSLLGVSGGYDAVFTNPPYMPLHTGKACEKEGKNAARHEVFGTISDFAATAARMLRYGGTFYAVYHPKRLCDLLDACRREKLEPKYLTAVSARRGLAPAMLLLAARLGGKPGLCFTKPLILQGDDGKNTADFDFILQHGNMPVGFAGNGKEKCHAKQ